MIFHELCHSLVQGEGSFAERDWGLDNETPADVPREEACLRVQATLAARHGLRRVLAPTTDFRAFYDALPDDALAPRGDPTSVLAILALQRAEKPPWATHLAAALEATRAVAERTAPFSSEAPGDAGLRDLWSRVDGAPNRHPSGQPPSAVASEERTCGSCAFRTKSGKCRRAGVRVQAELPGCERWEGALDCQACGACCRAAYDLVQVSARDPVRKKHPELIVVRGPYLEVRREGDRCAALRGGEWVSKLSREGVGENANRTPSDSGTTVPYSCAIYEDRPKSCRDFENGGEHCLTARRRVGLSL
jgi:Fe-S-cluster containining protein